MERLARVAETLSGFEVELSEALAKKLGVKVKLQATPWDGILAALESKRLDAVVNQVTISDARKEKYDFSKPYTVSGIQALTLAKNVDTIKTADDLAGKKIGVGLGTNYEQWLKEVKQMADRINGMRSTLKDYLVKDLGNKNNWDHITNQIGMFAFLGITPEQVAKLSEEHHVYLTKDGRISVAGITQHNVKHLAESLHKVTS